MKFHLLSEWTLLQTSKVHAGSALAIDCKSYSYTQSMALASEEEAGTRE